jgi:hypothetical protein
MKKAHVVFRGRNLVKDNFLYQTLKEVLQVESKHKESDR